MTKRLDSGIYLQCMSKNAVLLLNLGSPKSPSVQDVRSYLAEFLMDERVIDVPKWIRRAIVYGGILPFRPKKSAQAYKSVWTEEGAPLIVMSRQLQDALYQACKLPVYLAMRYGSPSITETVLKMKADGVQSLYIVPLYPHYAMSSYETVVVALMNAIQAHLPQLKTELVQPFYKDEDYIDALLASAQDHLKDPYDLLLFSFHGLPQRHLCKTDPSGAHCMKVKNCCQQANPAHATCYQHQCYETVKAFVKKAGIPEHKYRVSFQSRLGRDPWLQPYTDEVLERLPVEGVHHLKIICPAFVSDCLETLEEIAMEGRDAFMEAGGKYYAQIPCMNTHPAWVECLANRVRSWEARQVEPSRIDCESKSHCSCT